MSFQERIPKIVYQLQFCSSHEKDLNLSRAVLLNIGYTHEDIIDSGFGDQASFELFDEKPEKLDRVKKLFSRLRLEGVKIHRRALKPQDWLTRWKTHWKPAPLTKKLDVVPVWYKDHYKKPKGRDYILMDTLLSFGTGLHETTRFMAQFIESQEGKFESFLDIGTGTGILALVALKYGAEDVMAIDIGELSVQAAKDNMTANQARFKVKLADIKTYPSKITYDFVAANLITDDLIVHAQKILSLVKHQGLLAVSGVSLENLKRLRQAYSSLPLKCLTISRGKEWSGLLFQKTKS